MTTIEMEEKNVVQLKDLHVGDVFTSNGFVYMKTDHITFNALNLKTGDLLNFNLDIEVKELNAHMKVSYK